MVSMVIKYKKVHSFKEVYRYEISVCDYVGRIHIPYRSKEADEIYYHCEFFPARKAPKDYTWYLKNYLFAATLMLKSK